MDSGISNGWLTPLWTFLGALIGAFLGGLIALTIERIRRPNLVIEDDVKEFTRERKGDPRFVKWVQVKVINKPIDSFWRRWIYRSFAERCSAFITFHEESSRVQVGLGMSGRWGSSSDEPIPLVAVNKNGKELFHVHDRNLYKRLSMADMPPGAEEMLDIVVQMDDEQFAYGWNNESYFHDWRHEDRKLPQGHYFICVNVTCGDHTVRKIFRLYNSGHRDSLKMECSSEDQSIILFPPRKRK